MTYEKLVLLTLIFLVENMEPHVKNNVNSLHRLFFTQDHERLKDGLTKALSDMYDDIVREEKKNASA